MSLIVVASLFCLYLLIGGGIIHIWESYKIAVRKDYETIKDRWGNKPNNLNKVVMPFTILHIIESVVLLIAAIMVFKYGIVNVAKIVFVVIFGTSFAKKWVINNANKQT